MAEQTQAVTKAPATGAVAAQKPKTIRSELEGERFKLAIAKALPKHLTPDRFIRVALTAITKTPKLADCDQYSFFNALLTLSQLGIEPDGRRAHLIPFDNRKRGVTEVQLLLDYKGLVELAMRTGLISSIHADIVCDKDTFEYDRGELKAHKINFREPRGEMYAAYALCRFKDGTESCQVMAKSDIDGIRSRSRAGNSGPWVTDYNEMAKKTVFRRLSKWLPLSPEYRDAIEADADTLEETKFQSAKPIRGTVTTTTEPAADFTLPPAPETTTETTGTQPEEDNVPMTETENAKLVTEKFIPKPSEKRTPKNVPDKPVDVPTTTTPVADIDISNVDDFVEFLKAKCEENGIPEATYCAWFAKKWKLPPNVTSIEIMNEVAPARLPGAATKFNHHLPELKALVQQ
jgi:recombination protein RecT